MPLYRGKDKNGAFYSWGKKGEKYYYIIGNSHSRNIAKNKADRESHKFILENIPATRKYKRAKFEKQIKNIDEPRGSRTRFWSALAPQKGKERHDLKKKCGPKAFLEPKTEKYPVMAALTRTKKPCTFDERGILAAKMRACQQKDYYAATRAQKLGSKLYGWDPKAKPCKSMK